MNNLQLDDAMICRLVDAHCEGVDFSAAIDIAHVPEHLAGEAKEYWDTLNGTAFHKSTVLPPIDIIAKIFARVGVTPSPAEMLSPRPSPYMKYIMAFAVPMAVLVLMIGVSMRPPEKISTLSVDNSPVAISAFSALPVSGGAPAVTAKSVVSPMALRSASPLAKSVVPVAVEAAPKNDPRKLFAMLSSAGGREARSEATIDATYDAQLADLNATVVSQVNSQNNAPLQ